MSCDDPLPITAICKPSSVKSSLATRRGRDERLRRGEKTSRRKDEKGKERGNGGRRRGA